MNSIDWHNLCSAEKYTKRSSVLLLRLVFFSGEQTLDLSFIHISYSNTKFLTAKCFKSVQIISFRAYRGGPMPILQFALEVALTLCGLGKIKLLHKTLACFYKQPRRFFQIQVYFHFAGLHTL